MFKHSKDDGQMFLMVIGAGARHGNADRAEAAHPFLGILAVVISMMVFVSLINDREHRQLQEQVVHPVYLPQPLRIRSPYRY